MKKNFFIITSSFLLMAGCTEVVDADDLLDTEEKILIVGYLSPNDTIIRIDVSRTLPAIGTPLNPAFPEENKDQFLIKNANVTVSDENGDSTTLGYDDSIEAYYAQATSLTIETGRNYFLEVLVDGKEYNASCRIPEKIPEIEETITMNETTFGDSIINLNISFQDFKNERNFYSIGGTFYATYQSMDEEPFTSERELFFTPDWLIRDNLVDGGIVDRNSEIVNSSAFTVTNKSLTIQVAHMEETIFQNLQTFQNNEDADDDPFIEYSIAPDTFLDEGAIGIFAGYQITEKTIDFED